MVLADYQIKMEIEKKRLIFQPPIAEEQVGTTSVDLRLGALFRTLKTPEQLRGLRISGLTEELRIDPSDPAFDIMTFLKTFGESEMKVDEGEFYSLGSGRAVLAQTYEELRLPDYLAARVEGRSILARLGLTVHNTAPTIHAGYKGRITLEITNHGPFTIELVPVRLRVCQLILEPVIPPPENPYHGRFQDSEIV